MKENVSGCFFLNTVYIDLLTAAELTVCWTEPATIRMDNIASTWQHSSVLCRAKVKSPLLIFALFIL